MSLGRRAHMMCNYLPVSICFILSTSIAAVSYASREQEFKEYLNQAKALKDKGAKNTTTFVPEQVFINYSSNPNSAKYYNEESATASQTLKTDSIASLTLNKEGQVIAESSKIRPQFKINPEAAEIKNSNQIQVLAAKNIQGTLNEFITGEEAQIDTQTTKYLIKTCNEEVRPLTKICTKTPLVTPVTETFAYPNCRKAYVQDGLHASCASGYSSIVNVDRKEINIGGGRGWDISRLCVKPADPGEKTECLAGYLAYGAGSEIGGGNARLNTSPTTIPQNLHARVIFRGATHKVLMQVTLSNKTTNKTIYDGNYANNVVIGLPFSATQDQVFEYYFTQTQPFLFFRPYNFQTGLMCIYVDSLGTRKAAKVKWQEVCRDV